MPPEQCGTYATDIRRSGRLRAARIRIFRVIDEIRLRLIVGDGVHGGVKVYRGSATAARTYVEADRSRVDDYYLAEGTGLADRHVAVSAAGEAAGRGRPGVHPGGAMDGDTYEAWVAGRVVTKEVATGVAKGRLRTDGQAVRFVEVVINGPKTWSLAASASIHRCAVGVAARLMQEGAPDLQDFGYHTRSPTGSKEHPLGVEVLHARSCDRPR